MRTVTDEDNIQQSHRAISVRPTERAAVAAAAAEQRQTPQLSSGAAQHTKPSAEHTGRPATCMDTDTQLVSATEYSPAVVDFLEREQQHEIKGRSAKNTLHASEAKHEEDRSSKLGEGLNVPVTRASGSSTVAPTIDDTAMLTKPAHTTRAHKGVFDAELGGATETKDIKWESISMEISEEPVVLQGTPSGLAGAGVFEGPVSTKGGAAIPGCLQPNSHLDSLLAALILPVPSILPPSDLQPPVHVDVSPMLESAVAEALPGGAEPPHTERFFVRVAAPESQSQHTGSRGLPDPLVSPSFALEGRCKLPPSALSLGRQGDGGAGVVSVNRKPRLSLRARFSGSQRL